MGPPLLAQELLDAIIDHLHDDLPSLKSCSRVSRAFLPSCRSHIFSEITLEPHRMDKPSDPHLCRKFNLILDQSPDIATYVRELFIIDGPTFDEGSPPVDGRDDWVVIAKQVLLSILRKLLRLKTFKLLAFGTRISDTEQTSTLQPLLYTTFQLPALDSVELVGLRNVPVGFFGWPELKHLRLSDITVVGDVSSAPNQRAKLDSLVIAVNPQAASVFVDPLFLHPTSPLDISNLRELTVDTSGGYSDEYHAFWKVLQACATSLQCFRFYPCANSE